MTNRLSSRRASRARRKCRADLVHAAGCTFEMCCGRDALRHGDLVPTHATKVRMPRSLWGVLGRWP